MRLFILFFGLSLGVLQAQEKERILFVGNSFTFYWNLPSQVEQMAKQRGLNWEVTQTTASGASLRDHWQGNKDLKTQQILRKETFNRIVFQDHSTYPLVHIDTTAFYFNKLKSVLPAQTKCYLYATWMYPNIKGKPVDTNNRNPIEENMRNIVAGKDDQMLVVGAAFELFAKRYPEIELFTDDDKHPSPQGSYLAACLIFSTLSEQTSKGLQRRYSGLDHNNKKIYYNIVEQSTAEKCQQLVDELLSIGE